MTVGPGKRVPLAPRHRRDWSLRGRFGRRCTCGLRWSLCPDRRLAQPGVEPLGEPALPAEPRPDPLWNAPTTVQPLVDGVLTFTRAQGWRSNGGRR